MCGQLTFHTLLARRWDQGKLVKRETFDTLLHGMDVTETCAWASHYAKEAGIDAGLMITQRCPYPQVLRLCVY